LFNIKQDIKIKSEKNTKILVYGNQETEFDTKIELNQIILNKEFVDEKFLWVETNKDIKGYLK
jgi:hypothetical protein